MASNQVSKSVKRKVAPSDSSVAVVEEPPVLPAPRARSPGRSRHTRNRLVAQALSVFPLVGLY